MYGIRNSNLRNKRELINKLNIPNDKLVIVNGLNYGNRNLNWEIHHISNKKINNSPMKRNKPHNWLYYLVYLTFKIFNYIKESVINCKRLLISDRFAKLTNFIFKHQLAISNLCLLLGKMLYTKII